MNNKKEKTVMEEKAIKQIDFAKIIKVIFNNKRRLAINVSIAFVISSLFIICIPRTYDCTVKLAPEMSSMSTSSLGAVASSFGIDLSSGLGNSTDAIIPELYPDLMSSTQFKVSLFDVKVKTVDGKLQTTYYDYIRNHQKAPWWSHITNWLISLLPIDNDKKGNDNSVNPFELSKAQHEVMGTIKNNIACKVDKKTMVISITVIDQDKLICATMADSVKNRLQAFITDYRTNKAREDLAFTEKLYKESKKRYDKARQLYSSYADANDGLVLQSFKSKLEDLENEMQLQYNAYSMVSTQLNAARAKVQERTPAFTTLQCASVPLKASGPKRVIFVIVVTFLTFIGTSLYLIKKNNIL